MTLLDRIRAVVKRAYIAKVEDSGRNKTAHVHGIFGQTKEVEVFEQYGIHAMPVKNSEIIPFSLSGDESHSIANGWTGGDVRPKGDLDEGEVELYGPVQGQRILFKANGDIGLSVSESVLNVTSSGFYFEVGGAEIFSVGQDGVKVNGTSIADDHISNGKSGATHIHNNGNNGSPVTPPV